MRIVMLGQKGVPALYGGIERHVEELGARLAAFGHEVICYSRPWFVNRESGIRNYESGIKRIVTPSINTKHLDAISHTLVSTLHALLFVRPDIYHFHAVGPALMAWLPRIFAPRARVIVTFHCIDRKHAKWGLMSRVMLRVGEWAACRFSHETITVSRTLEQYCAEVYEKKTHYIPNGISWRRESGNALIGRFGLTPRNYVVFVARLVAHKGAHVLIEAWQKLGASSPEFVVGKKLVIVGDGAFTDRYVADLKAQAARDASIVFTGYQNGAMLDELFANALCAVHPSFSEGLPIAVLEAMSYGKVVLASDIPENLEALGPHGVSFHAGDVDDLVTKLGALIEAYDTLPELGARARQFVLEHYHWDDIAKKVSELYTVTSPQPQFFGRSDRKLRFTKDKNIHETSS